MTPAPMINTSHGEIVVCTMNELSHAQTISSERTTLCPCKWFRYSPLSRSGPRLSITRNKKLTLEEPSSSQIKQIRAYQFRQGSTADQHEPRRRLNFGASRPSEASIPSVMKIELIRQHRAPARLSQRPILPIGHTRHVRYFQVLMRPL